MSGNHKQKKFQLKGIRISTGKTVMLDQYARALMANARKLTPLIIKEQMSELEALIFLSMYTDSHLSGKETGVTTEQIQGMCNLVVNLWEQGTFRPGPAYPYTLKQTRQAMNEDGSEANPIGEDEIL